MKIFVTGIAGQLGHDLLIELSGRGHEVIGSDVLPSVETPYPYVSLDITNGEAVKETLTRVNPEAVIHCAAWTAVDLAEDEDKRERVFAINAGGTRNIAAVCRAIGAKMIYISTDYVFNGQGTEPWKPDCRDYAPLSVYGKSKLEGELSVAKLLERYFIVRIAWVFGVNGKNFVRTMLRLSEEHDEVRVVSDQFGTPTSASELAAAVEFLLNSDNYGLFHGTCEGSCSWQTLRRRYSELRRSRPG